MAEQVDVIICGSGSAGLCAATWLARYGVRCKILESRNGPLQMGQADGVQCRTVEIFESFGLVEELLRESYHVLEVAFWSKDDKGKLVRTSRAADTAPGLSHQPHVILNQARVNAFFLGSMKSLNQQTVDYGYQVKSVEVDPTTASDPKAYPVVVRTEKDNKLVEFRAKYVLACDGAHSAVRRSLGFKMIGDTTDAVWGVIDLYPRTNFPDIRRKVSLKTSVGHLMIIPREGGSLVRFYIELPPGTIAQEVTLQDLHEAAKNIFHPYDMEVAETFWWSAYSIGQRLADYFSKDNRVFLTGDACHTHSPKAGQGMNTSLQDGYNIGWKLATVIKGQASQDLLKTYNVEREKVAADLIEFDRRWTRLFATKKDTQSAKPGEGFAGEFIKAGRYTAGLTTKYADSQITNGSISEQSLGANLQVGMRFPSTQVVRLCDAKAIQFVTALPADGRWRIVIFAGDIKQPSAASRLQQFAQFLESPTSPIKKFTPKGAYIDSFIEVLVVLHGERVAIENEDVPPTYYPVTGKWKMQDLHKVFVDDESYNSGHGKAYEFYGVDPLVGAVVVVRPDQYVSTITRIESHNLISQFFDGWAQPIESVAE